MKPDNLGNQRGVQIAASLGSLDILYFFTTHFRVGTLREPALYHGVNINAGTEGGSRQGLDDTYNAAGFIISATSVAESEMSQGVCKSFALQIFLL